MEKSLFKMKNFLLTISILAFSTKAYTSNVDYGLASWYGNEFHGRKTASGEVFNQYKKTVASNHLPMGTRLKITCIATGRSTIAKVNDTGNFGKYGRKLDLSRGTADAIGLTKLGISKVKFEVLQ